MHEKIPKAPIPGVIPSPILVEPFPLETALKAAAEVVWPELPKDFKSALEMLKSHDAAKPAARSLVERIAWNARRKALGIHCNRVQQSALAPTISSDDHARQMLVLKSQGASLAAEIKNSIKKKK